MRFFRDAVLTVAILVVVFLVVGYASIGNLFSATARPGRLESSLAMEMRNLSIPADAKRARNPVGGRKDAWREGADHFNDHCAVCHGGNGRGGGQIGANLYPPVPDMTRPRTQDLSDGELFYIISNGVRWTGMPAWKNEHTPAETWRLVSFIRHLPSLTPAEMEQIEKASEEPHEGAHHHDDDAHHRPRFPQGHAVPPAR
jgi:mono/diheme cytochrome c family protein